MSTLHTLNKSPSHKTLFEQLIEASEAGDAILLIEDGVYYCMQSTLNRRLQDMPVYALKDDLLARGIPDEESDTILASYEDFVELTTQHDKVINWY